MLTRVTSPQLEATWDAMLSACPRASRRACRQLSAKSGSRLGRLAFEITNPDRVDLHRRSAASLPLSTFPTASELPPKSVFRRPLPDTLAAFSSTEGRKRFTEAMESGHLEPYFPLSEQFVTQNEPTFCGLGTLTVVMNALGIDPRRRWRDESGPGWRWWADEMFPYDSNERPNASQDVLQCPTLEKIRAEGNTMEGFRLLAATNGAEVTMHRPADEGEGLESFRDAIVTACRMQDDWRNTFFVSSFCRSALGQTGGGHFSPVAGYHEPTDSALIMDVARFKYPPYWVPLPQLYEASTKRDEATGQTRGWFLLSATPDAILPV